MKNHIIAGMVCVAALTLGAAGYDQFRQWTHIGSKIVTLEVHFEGPRFEDGGMIKLDHAAVRDALGPGIVVDPISKRVGDTYHLTLEVPSNTAVADLALRLQTLKGVKRVVVP